MKYQVNLARSSRNVNLVRYAHRCWLTTVKETTSKYPWVFTYALTLYLSMLPQKISEVWKKVYSFEREDVK